MTRRPLRVLVTDGDNRAALAITRSLGRQGHQVVVGEKVQPSLAQTSRYCVGMVTYPDPVRDSAGFVEALLRIVREQAIDMVMPVAEITTALVIENKSAFEVYSRVPFPDAETFNRAANKVEVITLARELGIPIPKSIVLPKRGDRPPESDKLKFPVVVKAHRSRIPVDGQWRSTSVSYAMSEAELEALLAAKHPAEYPVLLQERVVGPGMGVFMCYDRGAPVAVFSHRRLREKPPSGGVSVLCESVPVSPQLRTSAQVLFDRLKWQGVGMVEFKMDQADDTPKLMEINGRFWGSLQLAIDAGVDFPSILLRTATDERIEPGETYRIGVKSRWLLGDLDALVMKLVKNPDELHLPEGYAGKVRSIVDFMKLWQKDLHYDVQRFSDMKPGLHEAIRWVSRRD